MVMPRVALRDDPSLDSFQASSSTDDTSSSNFTGSTSSGSTIPGPGSISGKVILALGKATLRGAEYLIILRRLRFISSRFPHTDTNVLKGWERMYEDLLELARVDLYPKSIRLRAIRLLLAQIACRQTRCLVKALERWPTFELYMFVSELLSIFDPIRLSDGMDGAADIRELLSAYRHSAGSSDPLTAFVDFLSQISSALRPSALENIRARTLDFLLHAYVTGFRDPLTVFRFGSIKLRRACDRLLSLLYENTSELRMISEHPIHTLWPTFHELPFTRSIPPRERLHAWRSCNREIIMCRLRQTIDTMGSSESLNDGAMLNVCIDLIELAGSHESHFDLRISMRALRYLHTLIVKHKPEFQRDVRQYLELVNNSHFVDIMTRIFRRLSLVWLDCFPARAFFFLPSDTATFEVLAVPSIIHCLLPIATMDDTFLQLALEANVLGLLKDVVDTELIGISDYTHENFGQVKGPSNNGAEHSLLVSIAEHGLAPLLPNTPLLPGHPNPSPISEYRRAVLCGAFDVFLRRDDPADVPAWQALKYPGSLSGS